MAEQTFLGGRVRKIQLPTIIGPPTAPVQGIKRLLLDQGELAQFYDGEEGMHYIAALELRPGVVRGNHYHKFKVEWVYVLQGELTLALMEVADRTTDSLLLGPGELAAISPGVAHAMRARTAGFAIEFSPARFDPADTYRQVVEAVA